ncbi:MAG: tetratricopeptide repeat protein [Pseudomonadota bacterium]
MTPPVPATPGTQPTPSRIALTAIAAALAALLVGAAFSPSLDNAFLFWDDRVYLHDNPRLQALTPDNLWWMLTDSRGPNAHYNWQPLTALSHALDLAWFGFDPRAHRAGNLVLHAVATMAVFAIAWRLLRAAPEANSLSPAGTLAAAALASALFSVHPLRVESVVWIAERKDVLCGAFYLLAVAAWLQFRASGARPWRVATSVCALGACLAKPMAVSLPIVLVLLDHWPHRRWQLPQWRRLGQNIIDKPDLFAYALLTAVMALLAQSGGGGIRSLVEVELAVRFVNAAHSLLFYAGKFLAPFNLATLYPYSAHVTGLSVLAWMELALAGTLTVWSLRSLFGRPSAWSTLWLTTIVMLGPVMGIVQVGVQSAADRYTYLPMVGVAILVATTLCWPRWPKRVRTACIALALVAPLALLSQTRLQTLVWQSDRTLWEHTLALYPTALPVAHLNLGNALFRAGDIDSAAMRYERALELEPDNPLTWANLAWARLRLDQFKSALAAADRAIELDENSLQGWLSRAVAHQLQAQTKPAVAAYRRVLEIHPGNADAVRNLQLLGETPVHTK